VLITSIQGAASPLPPSSELQGHTFITADHRSSPTAGERHRPKSLAPPHRRPTSSVSPTGPLLALHHPGTPLVLSGYTLPSANCHQAAGECARGSLLCWNRPPGRGPASLSTGHAWQAAMPCGLWPWPECEARHYVVVLIIFPIDLIPRI
jgi:hypothetical protein